LPTTEIYKDNLN